MTETERGQQHIKAARASARLVDPRPLLVVSLLVLANCDYGGEQSAASADLRAEPRESYQEWSVSRAPFVEIGARHGEPQYELGMVAAAGIFLDGTIWVADRMRTEILLYDHRGNGLEVVGGRGGAPGEYRTISGAVPYRGDSLLIWDGSASRITVLDDGGRLGRTFAVRLPTAGRQGSGSRSMTMAAKLLGSFGDGSIVFSPPLQMSVEPGTRSHWRSTLVRYGAIGDSMGTIGPIPGPEFLAPQPSHRMMIATPFPRPSLLAFGDDRIYLGASAEYEIQVLNARGELIDRIRRDRPEIDVEAAAQAYLEGQRSLAEEKGVDAHAIEAVLGEIEIPNRLPAYSALIVDSEGYLWVRNFDSLYETGPIGCDVFDTTGTIVARASLPRDLEVQQIGRDFVLGTRTDSLGVPYVHVHKLERD